MNTNTRTISGYDPGLSDGEAVARVQSGEREFYGVLAERHNQRFCKLLNGLLRSPHDVEDVLQQAHLRALQNFDRFEGRSSFFAWFSRIAINEAYTLLRRRRNFVPLDQPGEDHIRPLELPTPEAGPEQSAIQEELRRTLKSAVASLSPAYRAVVSVRMFREMSTADAAEHLGLSEQGVKTRFFRAKVLLRRKVHLDSRAK